MELRDFKFKKQISVVQMFIFASLIGLIFLEPGSIAGSHLSRDNLARGFIVSMPIYQELIYLEAKLSRQFSFGTSYPELNFLGPVYLVYIYLSGASSSGIHCSKNHLSGPICPGVHLSGLALKRSKT